MKKKILALALLVILLAVAAAGGTLAYFTDSEKASNTFTVGSVDIELTEPAWDASGSKDADEVYPGEALKKDPTVQNIGTNPCFVRIRVSGLDCLGDKEELLISYETGNIPGALGAGWEKHSDGCYYYTKVLETNEKTTALFEQIRIPAALESGKADVKYDVEIFAESVQAQGAKPAYADVKTMTLEEIVAWFGTCMPANP